MVKLVSLLRDEFGVECNVIVPRKGDGVRLLEEHSIPYELVKSYDWVLDNNSFVRKFRSVARQVVSSFINPKAVRCLANKMKNEGYDLVHLNTTYAHTGALAALRAGVPFIWHLRELLEEDQGRSIAGRKRGYKLIGKADRVIAISSCVYEKYKNIIPSGKLVKIFDGIDVDKFYTKDRNILINPNLCTLIYGGGYDPGKGFYVLASALNDLRLRHAADFHLLMLGEPGRKCREYLHRIGLDAKIQLLGYQKDVEHWYRQADIAFNCSAMEAFGRKTVEAMLCGCLMIGSDTGGNLDIIEDKRTGYLFRQGDAHSLAETILYAIQHADESKAVAKAGQDSAYAYFPALENARQVYQLYQDVLKNR